MAIISFVHPGGDICVCTLDLCAGGFVYDSDSYADDIPYFVRGSKVCWWW